MIGTAHGLQGLLELGAIGRLSDGRLLDRFVARRDGAAFGALVDRHGPMVWGVCRRILRDHHDAEDALQATFLVLARRADSVGSADRLGAWLHGVALKTSMKARTNRAEREARETTGRDAPEPSATPRDPGDDLAESLDRALAGLPEKYRTPIVLCDLEGLSYAEAADRLGWPIGTVSGRLCRARAMLAKRLALRGVALSACALVSLSREATSATLPASRFVPLLKAASLTARDSWSGLVSAEAAALCQEVQGGMLMTKLKVTAFGLLTAGMLATGIGVLARGQDHETATQESSAPTTKLEPSPKPAALTKTYYIGDLILADPSKPLVDGRPQVDMSPLVDLITSTIGPEGWKEEDGTWKAEDGSAMVPFFLSLSLIIRGEPEFHDRVESLLRGLRRFKSDHAISSGLIGQHLRKLYDVGDLLRWLGDASRQPAPHQREALIAMISSTTCPRHWSQKAQDIRYVVSGPDDRTIFVGATADGHKQVESFLASLRLFRDAQTSQPPAAD